MSQASNRNFPRNTGEAGTFSKADGSARLDEIFDGIHTDHSGTTAPPSPVLGLSWLDTAATPYLRKQYDGANWAVTHVLDPVTGRVLMRLSDGSTTLPGLHYASDTDTGIRLASGEQRAVFGGVDVLALMAATNSQAIAGTDTLRPVTSAGLASSKSLGSSGYYDFPGNLRLQWQRNVAAVTTNSNGHGTISVTFPQSFSTAYICLGNTTNLSSSVLGAGATLTVLSATGASFTLVGAASTGYAFTYIAVGSA